MVTTASKFFYAGAVVAFVASYVYGIGTDGDLLGVLTLGLKGPVGELAGYSILQTAGAVLLGLGIASSILRDADPEVQAAAARLESLPPVVAPSAISYWPVLGALSAVVAAVGLVASPVLFVIGLLGVGLVVLEWMVAAWAERATGDPSVNREIRNRLMYPIEIPVAGALAILVMVVSVSRVLLTLSKTGSSVIAMVIAALVLAVAFLVAYRPTIGKNVVAGLLAVFAVALIAGGVLSAAAGPREFEPHEAGHTDDHEDPEGTDAPGGPDPGAEDDPSADNTADEGTDGEQEQPPGTAVGTDEGRQQGGDEELAPEDDESEG